MLCRSMLRARLLGGNSHPLACNFSRWKYFITHLIKSGHLLAAVSPLSHLLTGSVIEAGFAAVTDHVCLLASCLHCIS